MSRPRIKRMVSAVTFCAVLLGFLLSCAVVLLSGGGSGAAAAAPAHNNLTVPLPTPSIGPLSSKASVGGMPAVNTFAARQLPAAMHVQATLAHERQRNASQPRLVVSFPSLSGGYVSAPAFIPGSDAEAGADSSGVPVGPIILMGSAAGWSYLALSGAFDSDKTFPGVGNPQSSPTGTQTDPVTPSNPGGNNPPSNNPGGNPPGNNPPGNNNPGSPPGNNPGNPPGNNPGNPPGYDPGHNPGNPTGNNPGNPPGNNPGNPPGNEPGNPPGNNPGGPTGNNPGNPPGDNTPDNGKPQILPVPDVVPGDDLPVTTTPEPVSALLLGSGLAGVAALRRRRRRNK